MLLADLGVCLACQNLSGLPVDEDTTTDRDDTNIHDTVEEEDRSASTNATFNTSRSIR